MLKFHWFSPSLCWGACRGEYMIIWRAIDYWLPQLYFIIFHSTAKVLFSMRIYTRFTASDATSKHHHQWTKKCRWIAWEMLRSELLSLSDTFFCAVVERVNFSSVHRRSLSRRWLKKLTDSRSPSIEHTSMLLLAVECEWRELILQLRFSFILSFNQSRRHFFLHRWCCYRAHLLSFFDTVRQRLSWGLLMIIHPFNVDLSLTKFCCVLIQSSKCASDYPERMKNSEYLCAKECDLEWLKDSQQPQCECCVKIRTYNSAIIISMLTAQHRSTEELSPSD